LGIVESEELAAQAVEFDGGVAIAQPSNSLLQGKTGPVRTTERVRTVEVDGRRFEVRLSEPQPGGRGPGAGAGGRGRAAGAGGAGPEAGVWRMQGTVLRLSLADGAEGEAGAVICIVEAMKMENEVHAHRAGQVSQLSVEPGQPVSTGQVICLIGAD